MTHAEVGMLLVRNWQASEPTVMRMTFAGTQPMFGACICSAASYRGTQSSPRTRAASCGNACKPHTCDTARVYSGQIGSRAGNAIHVHHAMHNYIMRNALQCAFPPKTRQVPCYTPTGKLGVYNHELPHRHHLTRRTGHQTLD